ncbi:MAG: ABC transporter substrate-binding protein [Actinomycetota bacterium]|nr:ABC transporter substrate-binding protein [Actinomycetota bacterium]
MNVHRWCRVLGVFAVGATVAVVVSAATSTAGTEQQRGVVQLAMISPLTGPLSFVGRDNLAAARAAIRYFNARGGVRGRRIQLTVYDDASNPSEGVIRMQRIAGDRRFVGVIGSGFSSVGLAVAPIVSQARIPYISMASSAAQVTPAKPYYFMTTATSRLFAYSMARYLRKLRIRRIALMADNGGFGREGVRNVDELRRGFRLDIVLRDIFPLTTTSFASELARVRDSNAQAIWLWNATDRAVTLTKEMRQLRLRQRLVLTGGNASVLYLRPACPQANGALINTYLGPVARYLPRRNPSKRWALLVDRLLGRQGSTFNYDGFTAVMMFRTAMLRGGFSREGIDRALETRMKGFVGPGGRYTYSSVNHSGLQVSSMVVSRIRNCRLVPVPGQRVAGGRVRAPRR